MNPLIWLCLLAPIWLVRCESVTLFASEGLTRTPFLLTTQKFINLYDTADICSSIPFATTRRLCQFPTNAVDVVMNRTTLEYSTQMETLEGHQWFQLLSLYQNRSQLLIFHQDSLVSNDTYQSYMIDSDTSPVGYAIYENSTFTIYTFQEEIVCQLTQHTVNHESKCAPGELTHIPVNQIVCDVGRVEDLINTFANYTETSIVPLYPIFGSIALSNSPQAKVKDQCGYLLDYRLLLIVVGSVLGGIVVTIITIVIGLSCSLCKKQKIGYSDVKMTPRGTNRYSITM